MVHLFRRVFNVSSKLIDVFHRLRWIWSGALPTAQLFHLSLSIFHSLFWMLKTDPFAFSLALKSWSQVQLSMDSSKVPLSVRALALEPPRASLLMRFPNALRLEMMVLVLDWACHGAERSKMSTMTRRSLWGPNAIKKGMDQMCTGFLLALLPVSLWTLLIYFDDIDTTWYNIVVQIFELLFRVECLLRTGFSPAKSWTAQSLKQVDVCAVPDHFSIDVQPQTQ